MRVAVVQLGFAVFGFGNTEAEAIQDAREWTDGPFEIKNVASAVHGDFICAGCTEAYYAAASRDPGVAFYIEGGVVRLCDEGA